MKRRMLKQLRSKQQPDHHNVYVVLLDPAAGRLRAVRLYQQAQLLKEAAVLIETEEKIERPPDGTKDTTDAAAGAYLNAIASEEVRTLTVPQAPPAVVGISLHANASPEDPFCFFIRLKRHPREHFIV